MNERLLKARELGELLGLSTSTILDWHEAGRIASFKLGPGPGGPVRFRAGEVIDWLEERRFGPVPDVTRTEWHDGCVVRLGRTPHSLFR